MVPILIAGILLAFGYLFGVEKTFRFLTYGPITGALVGAIQTGAAVQVWVAAGQPDFYFRGWNGVEASLFLHAIGGMIFGIPFGAVLALYERLSGRRIRLLLFMAAFLPTVYVVARILVQTEFERNKLFPLFRSESTVMLIGLIVAVSFSKSESPTSTRQLPLQSTAV